MMRTAIAFLTLLLVSACTAGLTTGQKSPCHGSFRAEGKYFTTGKTSDGQTVVVSTMNSPDDCAD